MWAERVVYSDHADTLADAVVGLIDDGTLIRPFEQHVVDEVVNGRKLEIHTALRSLAP
jgi:hypothetical protein